MLFIWECQVNTADRQAQIYQTNVSSMRFSNEIQLMDWQTLANKVEKEGGGEVYIFFSFE
jgi:hypothetical protein